MEITGSPLLRRFLLGQISNEDGFFEVEKPSYFLIRTVFSEKFDFPSRSYKFSEKKLKFFFQFFFRDFQFHFQSRFRFRFSLTFKAYYISVVPNLPNFES